MKNMKYKSTGRVWFPLSPLCKLRVQRPCSACSISGWTHPLSPFLLDYSSLHLFTLIAPYPFLLFFFSSLHFITWKHFIENIPACSLSGWTHPFFLFFFAFYQILSLENIASSLSVWTHPFSPFLTILLCILSQDNFYHCQITSFFHHFKTFHFI